MQAKDLLPIGSVIVLKGTDKKVMIIGVCPQYEITNGEKALKDYIGVMYPEGYISSELFFTFDISDIETVVFEGYRGEGEWSEFLEIVDRAIEYQKNNLLKTVPNDNTPE